VLAVGGVRLVDAVRRDPTGAATRLLGRAVAVADVMTAVELQPRIPPGWLVVTRDGTAVATDTTVRLGRSEPVLERHAEAERLRAELMRLAEAAAEATEAAEATAADANAARAALDDARAMESRAGAARRSAEEAERATARALESVVREATWHEAQALSLEAEVARLREAAAAYEESPASDAGTSDGSIDDGAAIAAWESRATELRAARDRRAAELAAIDGRRRDAEARRARAEAAAAMDEERISRAERDASQLAEREAATIVERESLAAELAVAARREEAAATDLATLRSADSAARDGLATAEREASAARERLRAADDRLRAAERADLEARLGRDSLREQLFVELAGLGELGLVRLRAAGIGGPSSADTVETSDSPGEEDDTAALEAALTAAIDRWAAGPPPSEPPGAGRIATLRRRYHELGAANPFAVDEYAAVKARLESLESQEADLRRAIDQTRSLIGELTTMIAEQFRTSFRALETAFDARFQQLFGGGYAKLVLTDPNDLSGSGIEIVARPPGKKQQALAMLSGGERALTAVALLFAMLEVRPVPFCVLDEVDAALDEANVGRFTAALRDLAARTQFIVITHNRGTIEAADALYGVTVGDDSVSRVISLRLDEAQAIADRQRDGTLAEVS
jgi:chromosome segregation protein